MLKITLTLRDGETYFALYPQDADIVLRNKVTRLSFRALHAVYSADVRAALSTYLM